MAASDKYNEVIAIGDAGDSEGNVKINVYYVYGSTGEPKYMEMYKGLDFLENETTFENFCNDAVLSEQDKQNILVSTQEQLKIHANNLNILINNHNIPVAQRVVCISGMLLAMQDIVDKNTNKIDNGIIHDDLKGIQTDSKRDGIKVVEQIRKYLKYKETSENKRSLIMFFQETISLDSDRETIVDLDKQVSSILKENASVTKRIFLIFMNMFFFPLMVQLDI
jgi:hypothetical protein